MNLSQNISLYYIYIHFCFPQIHQAILHDKISYRTMSVVFIFIFSFKLRDYKVLGMFGRREAGCSFAAKESGVAQEQRPEARPGASRGINK